MTKECQVLLNSNVKVDSIDRDCRKLYQSTLGLILGGWLSAQKSQFWQQLGGSLTVTQTALICNFLLVSYGIILRTLVSNIMKKFIHSYIKLEIYLGSSSCTMLRGTDGVRKIHSIDWICCLHNSKYPHSWNHSACSANYMHL